jgi:triosephosphate isomerase
MKKTIVANWKMNKLQRETSDFICNMPLQNEVNIAIIPPFLSIREAKNMAISKNIRIGSQNMSEYSHGPYTGEVSASMLKDVGCDFVLLGHSERRKIFLENNHCIARKVERAVVENMPFILCVGETLEERNLGQTEEVIDRMLDESLSDLFGNHWKLLTVAYEPVWAIGTGKVADSSCIRTVHAMIREKLIDFDAEMGVNVPILYGGSVSISTISEILSIQNVDGVLVGGASLEALSFNQLINKAVS